MLKTQEQPGPIQAHLKYSSEFTPYIHYGTITEGVNENAFNLLNPYGDYATIEIPSNESRGAIAIPLVNDRNISLSAYHGNSLFEITGFDGKTDSLICTHNGKEVRIGYNETVAVDFAREHSHLKEGDRQILVTWTRDERGVPLLLADQVRLGQEFVAADRTRLNGWLEAHFTPLKTEEKTAVRFREPQIPSSGSSSTNKDGSVRAIDINTPATRAEDQRRQEMEHVGRYLEGSKDPDLGRVLRLKRNSVERLVSGQDMLPIEALFDFAHSSQEGLKEKRLAMQFVTRGGSSYMLIEAVDSKVGRFYYLQNLARKGPFAQPKAVLPEGLGIVVAKNRPSAGILGVLNRNSSYDDVRDGNKNAWRVGFYTFEDAAMEMKGELHTLPTVSDIDLSSIFIYQPTEPKN